MTGVDSSVIEYNSYHLNSVLSSQRTQLCFFSRGPLDLVVRLHTPRAHDNPQGEADNPHV